MWVLGVLWVLGGRVVGFRAGKTWGVDARTDVHMGGSWCKGGRMGLMENFVVSEGVMGGG